MAARSSLLGSCAIRELWGIIHIRQPEAREGKIDLGLCGQLCGNFERTNLEPVALQCSILVSNGERELYRMSGGSGDKFGLYSIEMNQRQDGIRLKEIPLLENAWRNPSPRTLPVAAFDSWTT